MAVFDITMLLDCEVTGSFCDLLRQAGEHFAAGFCEMAGAESQSALGRMARGVRRQLEGACVPLWRGETLYPAGPFSWYAQGAAITFSYSHSMVINRPELTKRAELGDAPLRAAYAWLGDELGGYFQVGSCIDRDISLGGANYTHSILNYGRILREGLCGYAQRVTAGLAAAQGRQDAEKAAFYRAMQDVLAGVMAAHHRSLAALEAAERVELRGQGAWRRLVEALRRVPWEPARGFFEALVATNFLYYIDGCDNLGRFDQDLGCYYEDDLNAGRITEEDGMRWVKQLWANIDANSGWNVAIGGSQADGSSASNRLTLACLRAAHQQRRPNLALRVAGNTPEVVLDEALDALATGSGIPALYNDGLYLSAIREAHLGVTPEDLPHYAFGGCTELMMHGRSNVGSLDAGLNLPLILAGTMQRALCSMDTFDGLWAAFASDLRQTVARLADQVSKAQEMHARFQPQPIRTLFIDDCLEAGIEFNAGGARYNWSVVNVGGLGNVVDSLAAVREVVYERGEASREGLWAALESNFEGNEALRQRLERCPRYGNDDQRADDLAKQVADLVFRELRRYAPWRGGRFLPSCLMFATYAAAGEPVMATPDGRLAGQPIGDSIGAVQGRDRHGPTALICSVAGIPQVLAPGTLVTNLRFARSVFEGEQRHKLKELIRTYFRMGGLQMQVTVVDQDTLRRAVADPERYGDLIVRIGGYSEYWRNLSPALRDTVLERTEHTA